MGLKARKLFDDLKRKNRSCFFFISLNRVFDFGVGLGLLETLVTNPFHIHNMDLAIGGSDKLHVADVEALFFQRGLHLIDLSLGRGLLIAFEGVYVIKKYALVGIEVGHDLAGFPVGKFYQGTLLISGINL